MVADQVKVMYVPCWINNAFRQRQLSIRELINLKVAKEVLPLEDIATMMYCTDVADSWNIQAKDDHELYTLLNNTSVFTSDPGFRKSINDRLDTSQAYIGTIAATIGVDIEQTNFQIVTFDHGLVAVILHEGVGELFTTTGQLYPVATPVNVTQKYDVFYKLVRGILNALTMYRQYHEVAKVQLFETYLKLVAQKSLTV